MSENNPDKSQMAQTPAWTNEDVAFRPGDDAVYREVMRAYGEVQAKNGGIAPTEICLCPAGIAMVLLSPRYQADAMYLEDGVAKALPWKLWGMNLHVILPDLRHPEAGSPPCGMVIGYREGMKGSAAGQVSESIYFNAGPRDVEAEADLGPAPFSQSEVE